MKEKDDCLWPSFVHPTVAERIDDIDFFLPSNSFSEPALEFFDDYFAPEGFMFFHLHLTGLAVEVGARRGGVRASVFFDASGLPLEDIYEKVSHLIQ